MNNTAERQFARLIKLGVELDPTLFRNPNERTRVRNNGGVQGQLAVRLRLAGIDPSKVRTRDEALARLGWSQENEKLRELREHLEQSGVPFAEPLSVEDARDLVDYGAPNASARRLAAELGIEVRVNASRVEVEDAIHAKWTVEFSTSEPATLVQKEFIRQMGVEMPEDLSRAEAAYIIETARNKPTRKQQGMLRFLGEEQWEKLSVDDAADSIDRLSRRCPEMLMAWERFAQSCPAGELNPDAVEFNCWRKYLDHDLRRRMRNRSRRHAGRGLMRATKAALGVGVIIGLLMASGAMDLVMW